MSKRLSKKEQGFVNDIADGMVPTQAALKNYDTEDYSTAGNIASTNLDKPKIINALRELGFDSDNAKRVVAEILNNDSLKPRDRIKAAENVFKVHGDYAPDKHVTLTLDESSEHSRELGNRLLGLLRR